MIRFLQTLFSVRPAGDDHDLKVLGETRIFENLALNDVERLAEQVEVRSFAAGADIFARGDIGDGLYVIDTGQVEVYLPEPAGAVRLTVLTDRDFFGEMALIDELGRRSASVRALAATRCLFLSREQFDALLNSSHATAAKILYRLCRVLSQRLERTSRQLGRHA